MRTCPFCKADLGDADLQTKTCSRCGNLLPSEITREPESAIGETIVPSGPAEKDDAKKTADERRFAQTIDSTAAAAPPGKDETKGTADDRGIAQTLEPGQVQPPSAQGGDAGSDDRGLAQTTDSGGVSLGPLPQGDPGTADDRRVAQTLDSGELPPEAAENISVMWSGRFKPETSPRTSIKAASLSVETTGELVIQPRVVREAKEGRLGGADYDLLHRLGEGGMGVVYAARQASIDRTVAIKMLKTKGTGEREERAKFLSEAVITGDLEHPNIVPIYDLGRNEAGALFYAMKRVKGTPWDSAIQAKSLQENLEILMKVADAVAFAHSRGVTHRDLKPENVMLGDFGEVLLMDWGLAMSPANSTRNTGMGGTPAYMAPEMASGPIERIGFASDVYLLGAILYEIVTGKTAHTGKNVMECLFAAARNEIQATSKEGELLEIARKAMATEPKDRYARVADFQNAIREYRSHTESISLAVRAETDLETAERKGDYEAYARALFGYQEALALWEGNSRARAGIAAAGLAYASNAAKKGDYDLAASLLNDDNPQHAELLRTIRDAQIERDARQQRLKAAKRIGIGLAVTVFVVVTVAFFWIRAQKQIADDERAKAVAAQGEAEKQRKEAVAQKEIADKQRIKAVNARQETERQRKEAVAQKEIADTQKAKAVSAQQEAERQRANAVAAQQQEEYEAYIARIGLAAAKIDENAFDRAVELLKECPPHLRNWEWGRLMHLSTRDIRAFDTRQPVDAAAFSPDGTRFVTGGWGGIARVWDTESGQELIEIPTGGQYVFAAAFSPDGRYVAAGGNSRPDYVKIWDARTGKLAQSLKGHGDAVLSVAYSRDGKRLLTGSYDNTARLWDLETGESKTFKGHEWWVWAAAFSPDETRIVTASQDGSAIVWSVETGQPGPPFLAHSGPVYAAAFAPDGQSVATGGYDKRVLLWKPDDLQPYDYHVLSSDRRNPPQPFVGFDGHTGGVRCVEFSADGKLLLSGGTDNTVRVWDTATGKALKVLRGHAGQVRACHFAPDGEMLLSAGHDHLAKLWDLAGYEEVRVFGGRVLEGHRDAILGAAFSPDGRQVVTASRDRTAKTWDFKTGKELRLFREGHEFLASASIFFPDGQKLLTAAVDNTTRIWDIATGTQLLALDGTGPSAAVALSSDGRWVLTGSDAQTAKLWDAPTGELLRTLSGHRQEVSAVAISPDNTLLFTGDRMGQCRLWDAKTGEEKWRAEGHSRGITSAVFLPDGTRVLTSSLDNTVGQWDVATGREELSLVLKHPDAVTSIAISPDGRQALTTCADKTVRQWDVQTAALIRPLVSGAEMINAVGFSPDGRQALTAGSDNAVRLWDVRSGQEIVPSGKPGSPLIDLTATGDLVWAAVFSPGGTHIATAGGSEAHLWDVASGRQMMRFTPSGSVASARFSPDGRRIITSSWDRTARIWNASSGTAELKLDGQHSQYINDAVFSPDGSKALTASDDKTVRLWDAHNGALLFTFQGHREHVRSAEFSSDGKFVLTASNDKTARIWNTESGELMQVLEGHAQAVLAAVFSLDGTRVITGSEDNAAKIWDASTGKELPFSLVGHTGSVTSVGFSPDGSRAVTGSQDNTAKIWDAGTGKEILTLSGHSQAITVVAFSPDGRSVLTGSRDGRLIIWLTADWRGK
jgi:hypothetical protein